MLSLILVGPIPIPIPIVVMVVLLGGQDKKLFLFLKLDLNLTISLKKLIKKLLFGMKLLGILELYPFTLLNFIIFVGLFDHTLLLYVYELSSFFPF